MERKVIKDKLRGKNGRDLRVLDGGKRADLVTPVEGGRESGAHKRRQFPPASELAEALADTSSIDYEQLRADLYAVVDPDPTPRYWVD